MSDPTFTKPYNAICEGRHYETVVIRENGREISRRGKDYMDMPWIQNLLNDAFQDGAHAMKESMKQHDVPNLLRKAGRASYIASQDGVSYRKTVGQPAARAVFKTLKLLP